MNEKLGNWHFWLTFIGDQPDVLPDALRRDCYGMPRRIYTYDAGQGWDTVQHDVDRRRVHPRASALLSSSSTSSSSRKRGAVAGNDPWDAPTLEWSIPSPPPEYNFAQIPMVTSRYPLWDLKAPGAHAEVPHSEHGDERVDVDVGRSTPAVARRSRQHPEAGRRARMHIEDATGKTAKELGIPMPNPTIKPLVCARWS